MNSSSRRVRVPLTVEAGSLRRLAEMIQPGSGARLELVPVRGRRMRLACGLDPAGLAVLVRSVAQRRDASLELVLSTSA